MSKILLVEDNPDAVKRIIRYINKIFAELDVVSFPEAGDALQYAKANDASLFILDIQLSQQKEQRRSCCDSALPPRIQDGS